MNDLDKLIEAVEADDVPFGGWSILSSQEHIFASEWARQAHNGSLDAAKALHEALLPGWVARPTVGGRAAGVIVWHCTVEDWENGEEVHANNLPDPARAWLLAILRAYDAEMSP